MNAEGCETVQDFKVNSICHQVLKEENIYKKEIKPSWRFEHVNLRLWTIYGKRNNFPLHRFLGGLDAFAWLTVVLENNTNIDRVGVMKCDLPDQWETPNK